MAPTTPRARIAQVSKSIAPAQAGEAFLSAARPTAAASTMSISPPIEKRNLRITIPHHAGNGLIQSQVIDKAGRLREPLAGHTRLFGDDRYQRVPDIPRGPAARI